jgi:hypothetical protein
MRSDPMLYSEGDGGNLVVAVSDRPVLSSERATHIDKTQLSDRNINLVLGRRWGLTQILTDRVTVGRNVTLTNLVTFTKSCETVAMW